MSGPSDLVYRLLEDVTLMVADVRCLGNDDGASRWNRGYQTVERRGLEEQGRERRAHLYMYADGKMRLLCVSWLVFGCGVTNIRYGHRRYLTCMVSCVSVK